MTISEQELHLEKPTLPPGPRKLPYIGNLLSLRRDPLSYLQSLQRTYGNMATIHLGRTPLVLLFRPEHVRYVLIENPRSFTNQGVGPGNDENSANEGLLTIDGEQHRQQRRAVQPAFHKKRVEGYFTIMEHYTQELLATWQIGDKVDLSSSMQALTLRIVSKCLFGIDLSSRLSQLGNVFNDMIGGSTTVAEDLLNIRIDNTVTGYGKRMAATRQLDMLIYTLLAQRKEDTREHNDVLSMLMETQSGADPETKLTDKQIRDHILTFLAAGHETTANWLVWTFYLLAKYPEVRRKVQAEIHDVLGNRDATLDDLSKLRYSDWVLSESMRLYPPAWLQMRIVAKEVEIDGYRLPKGTLVMMNQWILHRLPDIWGDPEAFRPERWDPEHGQQVPSGAYFPFGGGPRICIGMPLAQMEARLILATILQRYTPQTALGYEPGFKPVITLRPKHNLEVTLLPANLEETEARMRQIVTVADVQNQRSERKGCRSLLFGNLGLNRGRRQLASK